jgi:hypothetical protein
MIMYAIKDIDEDTYYNFKTESFQLDLMESCLLPDETMAWEYHDKHIGGNQIVVQIIIHNVLKGDILHYNERRIFNPCDICERCD